MQMVLLGVFWAGLHGHVLFGPATGGDDLTVVEWFSVERPGWWFHSTGTGKRCRHDSEMISVLGGLGSGGG